MFKRNFFHEAIYILRFSHACFSSATSYSGCFGSLLKGETGEASALIWDPASIPDQSTRDLWLRNLGLKYFSPCKSVFPCDDQSHECFRLPFLYVTTDATSLALYHRRYITDSTPPTLRHRRYTTDATSLTLHHRRYITEATPPTLHHRSYTTDATQPTLHHRRYIPDATSLTLHHRRYITEATPPTLHHWSYATDATSPTLHHRRYTTEATPTLHHRRYITDVTPPTLHHRDRGFTTEAIAPTI